MGAILSSPTVPVRKYKCYGCMCYLPSPDKIPVYTGNEISLYYVVHKEEKAMERKSVTLGWRILPGFAEESGKDVTTTRELVYIGINHADGLSNIYCLNCFSKYLDNMVEWKDKERLTNEINTLDAQYNLGGVMRYCATENTNHVDIHPPAYQAGVPANIGPLEMGIKETSGMTDVLHGSGNDFDPQTSPRGDALKITSAPSQGLE